PLGISYPTLAGARYGFSDGNVTDVATTSATSGSGTSRIAPHCGHWAFLPTESSGTRSRWSQRVQVSSIPIATTPRPTSQPATPARGSIAAQNNTRGRSTAIRGGEVHAATRESTRQVPLASRQCWEDIGDAGDSKHQANLPNEGGESR